MQKTPSHRLRLFSYFLMIKNFQCAYLFNRIQTIRDTILFEICTNNTIKLDSHLLSSATFWQEYNLSSILLDLINFELHFTWKPVVILMFDLFKTNTTINSIIHLLFNVKFILHLPLHQICNLNNFFLHIFFSNHLRLFVKLLYYKIIFI